MGEYRKNKIVQLYNTKEYADCTFRIKNEEYPAHKFVLACSSPVFESMLYGKLASNMNEISDIDGEVFDKALAFIYTEDIVLGNVEEAWNLYYVAQKYLLDDLEHITLSFIYRNLSLGTLALSYEYATLYNQNDLADKCIQLICIFTKGIYLYIDYHLQVDTLKAILKQNKGNGSDLIMLAVRWSMEECQLEEIKQTFENVYEMLVKNNLIELLLYKPARFVLNDSLLKPLTKEKVYLYENLFDYSMQLYKKYLEITPMNYNQFKLLDFKSYPFRYRDVHKNSANLRIFNSELLSPTLKTNEDVILFGIAVSTKSRTTQLSVYDYIGGANVYIYKKNERNMSTLIFEHEEQRVFLQYGEMQLIVFAIPVLLKAYQRYMLCIEYLATPNSGESVLLKYLSEKLISPKSDTAVIEFEDEGNGSVLRGLCYFKI